MDIIRISPNAGAIGFRFGPRSFQAKGVSTTDANYDRTAFLNLAALLMDEELPKYLADRWTRFNIRGHPTSYSVPLLGTDYSKMDLDDLKAKVAQQLRLFPSGDIGQSATKLVMAIAQELGLAELKPELEKISQEQTLEEKTTYELRTQIQYTLRWFAIKDDPQKLYEFAIESADQVFDACRRLQTLNPARAIEALKFREAQEKDETEVQFFLQSIDEIQVKMDSGKAGMGVNDDETRAVLRFTHLSPDSSTEKRAAGLIAVIADERRTYEDRTKAMDLLAPSDNPWRFSDPSVDEFLKHIVDSNDNKLSWLAGPAILALAQRGGSRWWDFIMAKIGAKEGPGPFTITGGFSDYVTALVTIAIHEDEPFQSRLRDHFAAQIANPDGGNDYYLWEAWMADLRELKPQIEKLATSSPSDVEGDLGKSPTNRGGQMRKHFHSARVIASLWNEEDPATRAKMLIGLAIVQRGMFAGNPGAESVYSALAQECKGLTSGQREEVLKFVDWCGSEFDSTFLLSRQELEAWLSQARECLGAR